MNRAVTRNIEVQVRARYAADQSQPSINQFFYFYTVTIRNLGKETVQLMARTWQIQDDFGVIQSVHGSGVIGVQPIIRPGGEFQYTSACELPTPRGKMLGQYHMVTQNQETGKEEFFDIQIPEFRLVRLQALASPSERPAEIS